MKQWLAMLCVLLTLCPGAMAQQAGGADPGQQSYEQPPQDDVVDADYEVVDDDK